VVPVVVLELGGPPHGPYWHGRKGMRAVEGGACRDRPRGV